MSDARDRIIAATTELLRHKGFRGTTLLDIATAADATVSSVNELFPGGTAALVEAAVLDLGALYRQLFDFIAGDAVDLAGAVTRFFGGAADVLEELDYVDVCPIGTVASEAAGTDDRIRLAADAAYASWIDAVASHLRRAGVHAADAEGLATTFVAALQGGFLLARCRRDAGLLRITGHQVHDVFAARLAAVAPGTDQG